MAPPLRRISFDDLCPLLAKEAGGYTLWVGAGAAIAIREGLPTWDALTHDLLRDGGMPQPAGWEIWEMLRRLAYVAAPSGARKGQSDDRGIARSKIVTVLS